MPIFTKRTLIENGVYEQVRNIKLEEFDIDELEMDDEIELTHTETQELKLF